MNYILSGILFFIICMLLVLYITGRGLNGKKHYKIGFQAVIVSYLLGLCLLFAAILYS